MGAPFNVVNENTGVVLANFDAQGNLQLSGNAVIGSLTPLASGGVGVIELANATTAPTNVTPGGIALYSNGGVAAYKNAAGLINTLTGSQGGITTSVTVANNNTEQVLQTVTIPANDVIAGAVYHSVAWGQYSDTLTPTLTFTTRWGGVAGTLLAQVPAITLGSGVTNVPFKFEVWMNFLSKTTVQAVIELDLGTSSTTDAASPFIATPTSATTVTTTGANAWVSTVTWSAASASNTISMLAGFTERLA